MRGFLTVMIITLLTKVTYQQSQPSNSSANSNMPLTSDQLANMVAEVKEKIGNNEALNELFKTVDLDYVRQLSSKDARSYINRTLFEPSEDKTSEDETSESTQEVKDSVTKENSALIVTLSTWMVLGCPVVFYLL
uniref:AlNc14C80G5265 protein n=1 Tax=Albugo laibachii Nc14 TaxID=890382 RepID=F0WF71_9STRA|nr:AlNc14C80G5265 [Albugo laibachii Nc14]|eukprot:CCA19853.1 AlNc14C80G5265 [Albugo laibachii Nc14]